MKQVFISVPPLLHRLQLNEMGGNAVAGILERQRPSTVILTSRDGVTHARGHPVLLEEQERNPISISIITIKPPLRGKVKVSVR